MSRSTEKLLIADAQGRVIDSELLTKQRTTSFYLCTKLLRKKLQKIIFNYYCLARITDEIEDSAHSTNDKIGLFGVWFDILEGREIDSSKIEEFKTFLNSKVSGKKDRFIINHLENVLGEFKSFDPKIRYCAMRWLEEMAYGMHSFLDKRIETPEDYKLYSYYVAGTVGLFAENAIKILYGVGLDASGAAAVGRFLQGTNILRNLPRDWMEGRNYVPRKKIVVKNEDGVEKDVSLSRILGRNLSVRDLNFENKEILEGALEKMVRLVASDLPEAVEHAFSVPPEIRDYGEFMKVPIAISSLRLQKMHNNLEVFFNDEEIEISKVKAYQIYLRSRFCPYGKKSYIKNFVDIHRGFISPN